MSLKVDHPGLDSWGGTLYIGTGCFHRRETLSGRKYGKDYKEDWKRGVERKTTSSACMLEERAKSLVTCTYEHNTQWGQEVTLSLSRYIYIYIYLSVYLATYYLSVIECRLG